MRRAQPVVGPIGLLLLVASGCLSGGGDEHETANDPSRDLLETGLEIVEALEPGATLSLSGCEELDIIYPTAMDSISLPHGLEAIPADPLARTTYRIPQILRCAEGEFEGVNETEPAITMTGIPVRPHPDLRIEGVPSYYFLERDAISPKNLTRLLWTAAGEEVHEATLYELEFSDVGGRSRMRADHQFRSDADSGRITALFGDEPSSGASGSLGVYVGNDTVLRLHRIDFSDYRQHRAGAATTDAEGDLAPLSDAVQSAHFWDFSLAVEFNVGILGS